MHLTTQHLLINDTFLNSFLLLFCILGVAWSFRFATFGKKMVISNQPHLEIKDWLIRLELPEYEEHLKQYNGVEEIINLSESEIKELGIKNSAHRARMVSSLVALKGKFKAAKFVEHF